MSNIKNLKPNSNSSFQQGYFKPGNLHKYKGDPNKIIYRSSWESRFMQWCDMHPNIKFWGSEPIAIPYVNPCSKFINGKYLPARANYYVDFYIVIDKKDGKEEKWFVEIKPGSQVPTSEQLAKLQKLNEKKKTEKQTKSYNYQLKTLLVNRAKFLAAKKFALERGCQFAICDENFLF